MYIYYIEVNFYTCTGDMNQMHHLSLKCQVKSFSQPLSAPLSKASTERGKSRGRNAAAVDSSPKLRMKLKKLESYQQNKNELY